MKDNTNIHALFTQMGMKVRTFVVDYSDMRGQDYNKPLYVMNQGLSSDAEIIAEAKRELHSQGYRVTAIHEVLDIQGYERLLTQKKFTSAEALKCMRPVYSEK